MKFYPVILILFIINAKTAFSGPPFLTDDPEPVELHHFEFYLSSQSQFSSNSASGTLPHIEINYGSIKNVQFHFIAPLGYNYSDQLFYYGLSDIELGIKYRFIEESDNFPQIGTFPLVELPSGNSNKGLGNGKAQLFVPIWLQKSWGDWTSYGGGGYWFNPAEGNKNWVFIGWLLQKQLSESFTLGGELYYNSPKIIDGKSLIGLNLGGILDFNDHLHLIFSGGRTITGDNAYTFYVGLLGTM